MLFMWNVCGDDATVGDWRQAVSGLRRVRCDCGTRWTLECNDCVLVWWIVRDDDGSAGDGRQAVSGLRCVLCACDV